MKKYIVIKISCIFFCIILLLSCSPQKNIYFVTESYFWEVIDYNGKLEEEFSNSARLFGLNYSTVISDENHQLVLQDILKDGTESIVILSPFMNNMEIPEQYPETLFITFGDTIETDLPDNLLTVVFDRTEAYRKAGKYIAELVLNSDIHQKGVKIGIIYSNISKQTENEVDAFKHGITETADESIILEREILNIADHAVIRSAVEEMRNNGAFYFLFKLFQSNLYCLESIENLGGYAVVEDWRSSKISEEHVILSVEEDYNSTIRLCLEQMETRNGNYHWKLNKIDGIVILE
jgi:hypothetical protein